MVLGLVCHAVFEYGPWAVVVGVIGAFIGAALAQPDVSSANVLAGTAGMGDGEVVRRDLEARIGTRVELADPRTAAALTDVIDPSPELADALTPLVGVLRRDARAA